MAKDRGISISKAHHILCMCNLIDNVNKAENIDDLKESIVFLLQKNL